MNFKKQDEDLSPAEIRELKSRLADLHNPVRYVIYSDLLPNGRWRLFLNVSDGTFCDQLDTATLFKREHAAQAVARVCSERRHRDLLVAKITTRSDKRKVLKYALSDQGNVRKKRPPMRDLMKTGHPDEWDKEIERDSREDGLLRPLLRRVRGNIASKRTKLRNRITENT